MQTTSYADTIATGSAQKKKKNNMTSSSSVGVIKFDQDWPTGLWDILIMCIQRTKDRQQTIGYNMLMLLAYQEISAMFSIFE